MTHYLTKIDINPRRRGTVRLLASPHRLHGAVNACFPASQRPERPLWRLDRTPSGTALYLVSDVAPDPTSVVEEYGWPLAGGWQTRDYAPVLSAVRTGTSFAFRLAANPVHNVPLAPRAGSVAAESSERPSPRTKRLAHVTVSQQLDWFTRRCAGWGFTVEASEGGSVQVVDRRTFEFDRQGRKVTIAVAAFEGVLRVTDEGELRRRLIEGIGHAKAYGCGLMTLAPAAG